jgi:hypothetical protein
VEPHHFAGAGARQKNSGSGAGYVCKFIKKCYKNLIFFILKFKVEFKNQNFVATGIYFKEPFYDHLRLKKTGKFCENMKIVNFMWKMVRAGAGIFDKQEPEPHKNGPAPQH